LQELSDPSRYRPDHCPLCRGREPLRAHGFYCRTLVDVNYDGAIPVRRYLCLLCKRTVSLLPEFALPYLRFSIQVIGLFLRNGGSDGTRTRGLLHDRQAFEFE
jgi:hypothetical protein